MSFKRHEKQLNEIANSYLKQAETIPNFTNMDFLNAVLIFQTAVFDKAWDSMEKSYIKMEERDKIGENLGFEIRALILKYTGLDMHNFEEFIKE